MKKMVLVVLSALLFLLVSCAGTIPKETLQNNSILHNRNDEVFNVLTIDGKRARKEYKNCDYYVIPPGTHLVKIKLNLGGKDLFAKAIMRTALKDDTTTLTYNFKAGKRYLLVRKNKGVVKPVWGVKEL